MRITEMMSLIAAVQLLAKCNCTVMLLNESHATGETSQAKTAVSDAKHFPAYTTSCWEGITFIF